MNDPFEIPPDVLRRVPLFAEIAKVLSWTGGPVNWDLARQIATSVAAGPPIDVAVDAGQIAEQVRLAEMWLADSCGLPSPAQLTEARAVTPVEWADRAPATLAEIVDPVAGKVVSAIEEQARALPDGDATAVAQTLGQLAPMLLGMQAGAILGNLATEVTGDHELGLPVAGEDVVLVVPAIDRISNEYGLEPRSVRQWVALRASAHRMLLEGFPWVRAHFFALYHDFVATLDVDLAEGMRRLQGLDLSDATRIQEALGAEGIFTAHASPSAERAAERIGTFLSLIDEHAAAASEHAGRPIGDTARLTEAFARRAATEGRGAHALAGFVGLDPAPGRRAAAAFVRAVVDRSGWARLNGLWEETESYPTEDELSEPDAWLGRTS